MKFKYLVIAKWEVLTELPNQIIGCCLKNADRVYQKRKCDTILSEKDSFRIAPRA